jgi:hypothetical protein
VTALVVAGNPVIGVYVQTPFEQLAVSHDDRGEHLGNVTHCPFRGLHVLSMQGSDGWVQFTRNTKSEHVTRSGPAAAHRISAHIPNAFVTSDSQRDPTGSAVERSVCSHVPIAEHSF